MVWLNDECESALEELLSLPLVDALDDDGGERPTD